MTRRSTRSARIWGFNRGKGTHGAKNICSKSKRRETRGIQGEDGDLSREPQGNGLRQVKAEKAWTKKEHPLTGESDESLEDEI